MSRQQQRLPDLLRERRLELGLPQQAPPLMPKEPLLLRGALLGGAAVGVALAFVVGLGWIEAAQRRELETLLPFERQVRSLEGQIKANRGKLSSFKKDTLQIAEQLVAVPAGSPLLEQLRRVTPAGIQLEDVSVQNDRIKVSGKAAGNHAGASGAHQCSGYHLGAPTHLQGRRCEGAQAHPRGR